MLKGRRPGPCALTRKVGLLAGHQLEQLAAQRVLRQRRTLLVPQPVQPVGRAVQVQQAQQARHAQQAQQAEQTAYECNGCKAIRRQEGVPAGGRANRGCMEGNNCPWPRMRLPDRQAECDSLQANQGARSGKVLFSRGHCTPRGAALTAFAMPQKSTSRLAGRAHHQLVVQCLKLIVRLQAAIPQSRAWRVR